MAQGITDFSGRVTIPLSETNLYGLTVTKTGFLDFTGNVTPTQDEYIITLTRSVSGEVIGQFQNIVISTPFAFDNLSGTANTTLNIIDSNATQEYFGVTIMYNGTNTTVNISGSPSGGGAFVSVNADPSSNDTVITQYFYKQIGQPEQVWIETHFITGLIGENTSLTSMLDSLEGESGLIRGIVGAFVLLFFMLSFSLFRNNSITVASAIFALFIIRQFALWPTTLTLIAIIAAVIFLIADNSGVLQL